MNWGYLEAGGDQDFFGQQRLMKRRRGLGLTVFRARGRFDLGALAAADKVVSDVVTIGRNIQRRRSFDRFEFLILRFLLLI